MTDDSQPILVTGTHRSGTTWVGDMLALSPEAHYIHEPFAPMYERAWVREPTRERYLYLPPDERSPLDADLARIAALRPPWVHIARRAGGLRNGLRLGQEAVRTALARRRGSRALIKDPFALLLAEWLVARTDASVVVLVRHPAAFVSSVVRLAWRMPTDSLVRQPALVSEHTGAFLETLERDRRGETDLVEHACLVWSVLNEIVATYERRHPSWEVLRYEDLASDPLPGFERLYTRMGLTWSAALGHRIEDMNAPRHGADVASGSPGGTRRDSSRAMWTWSDRLRPEEVVRVRRLTEPTAHRWYGDTDWEPPRDHVE